MDASERRNKVRKAADWWGLLDGDSMTRVDREEFVDWLRDSQTNVAEMLRLIQVQADLNDLKLAQEWPDINTDRRPRDGQHNVVSLPIALSPVPPAAHLQNSHPSPSPSQGRGALDRGRERMRNPSRGLRLFAFAATLAAVGVVTAFLVTHFNGQLIETDRGERREVVLGDGSMVQLDEQTRLNVRFDKSQRQVLLTQGRAVFRVAKNAQRPFLVEAGGTTVRAIGTAFGVDRRVPDQVVVTVSEGKVAVSSMKRSPSRSNTSTDSSPRLRHPSPSSGEAMEVRNAASDDGEVYLTANEQLTVAITGASQAVRPVDSQRELAWAGKELVFNNDTVATVIAEFNRYNRVQLEVTDPQFAARPVSGVFDATDPEDFLAFLQNAAPVRIERNDERSIVISPSASP